MHEVLVNRLGGLRLPIKKTVVWLADCPVMTLGVNRGRKNNNITTTQPVLYNFLSEQTVNFTNADAFWSIEYMKAATFTLFVCEYIHFFQGKICSHF